MVNLVRSGTKQPQPFSTSAEGQARHLPFLFAPFSFPCFSPRVCLDRIFSDAGWLCAILAPCVRCAQREAFSVGLCAPAHAIGNDVPHRSPLFFSIAPLASLNGAFRAFARRLESVLQGIVTDTISG